MAPDHDQIRRSLLRCGDQCLAWITADHPSIGRDAARVCRRQCFMNNAPRLFLLVVTDARDAVKKHLLTFAGPPF
jgi:hypothetical protein